MYIKYIPDSDFEFFSEKVLTSLRAFDIICDVGTVAEASNKKLTSSAPLTGKRGKKNEVHTFHHGHERQHNGKTD